MTNSTGQSCPEGLLRPVALFELDDTTGGRRYRFSCALCVVIGVDEAGELCADCAAAVLADRVDPATKTTKPVRTRRRR